MRRTIRTIHNVHKPSSSSSSVETKRNSAIGVVQEIPNLHDSDRALALLNRLKCEFGPIARARGYTLTSLTELCCCADGWEYISNTNRKTNDNKNSSTGSTPNTKRMRTIRRVSNNIAGYNQTHGRRNRIHIRLRHPGPSHSLLSYEEVCGVMVHELTHCEIGPHSADFYELMQVIARQHAMFLERGVVLDTDGFPMGTVETHVLNSGSGAGAGAVAGSNKSARDLKQAVASAAQRREQVGKIMGTGIACTQKGKDVRSGGKVVRTKLNPREAARIAAEQRFIDSKWCMPCEDTIDLYDDDNYTTSTITADIPRNTKHNLQPCKKIKAVTKERSSTCTKEAKILSLRDTKVMETSINSKRGTGAFAVIDLGSIESPYDMKQNRSHRPAGDDDRQFVIDLTMDIENDNQLYLQYSKQNGSEEKMRKDEKNRVSQKNRGVQSHHANTDPEHLTWNCRVCTFCNRPSFLSCEACGQPRLSKHKDGIVAQALATKIQRDDTVDYVRRTEIHNSKAQFNGFDIYGN